jgi:hypothetical protein
MRTAKQLKRIKTGVIVPDSTARLHPCQVLAPVVAPPEKHGLTPPNSHGILARSREIEAHQMLILM